MARITSTKTHTSGIALGGIGSGSVEILPDGEFHYWLIANQPRLTKRSHETKVDDGEGSTGALSFWIRAKSEGSQPVVRKLGMKTDAEDFTYRMFAWNKPIERIDFDGRFPLCDLDYIDSDLPCKVSLRAVSPFVPHNSDASATPGFYLDFTVENPSDEAMEISLLGALEPNFTDKKEGSRNSLVTMKNGYGIHIEPVRTTRAPSCGDVCLSVKSDGENSYITADYFRYLKEYVANSDFGVTQESFLFGFRESGTLPNSTAGRKPPSMPINLHTAKNEKLDYLCEEYSKYPFASSLLKRIQHITPAFPPDREEKIAFLRCCSRQMWRMGTSFGSCALCSKLTLAPGEKKRVSFVFSWYFPNHFAKSGKRLGHYYENLYKNSLDANRFLTENRDSVCKSAVDFADLLYNTDLPSAYPDAWSSNLSQLVKSSCYLKNGKFGLWEGLGFCGFHTTDITYHASFGLVNLFPDLQKKQIRMGAEFQRKDGRVHHLFLPGLEQVDRGFDRVDMNMQFVLMVLRDYLFTGDREYLSSLWDNVIRAMDSIERLDRDGDGLPDSETKRNTYDAWNFSGTPAYISILWLAALKAAAIIAEKMEDRVRQEKWNAISEKGKNALEEKLWNKEYYNLWRKENRTDESLMTDQLDGEWFLRAMGVKGNLSDERIRDVVKLIFENNFDSEAGLINASCPDGRKTTIHTYKNCQAEAAWTGIGYAFCALALSVGLREIADTEISSIHSNQMRFGSFWDHWECGHHYTRPMSSWTTLHAALGLSVDYESRKIAFKPIDKNIKVPLCLPGILATVSFSGGKLSIAYLKGNLDGWEITTE